MSLFAWLLGLVPLSLVVARAAPAESVWIFLTALAALVPLAEWIRRATEHLAERAGSAIGGLVNVTFGNSAELILALFVLRAGHAEVVKAQITGSIIGNSLLGLGLAATVGGAGRVRQHFSRASASRLSTLLVLSVIAILLPALFDYTERGVMRGPDVATLDERLSLGVAVVLILVYVANLVYTLVTHRDVFAQEDHGHAAYAGAAWSLRRSFAVLLAATAGVALESELIAGALEETAAVTGLSPFFLGVIVLAVLGNAAEYVAAVYFARRDRMGLAFAITVGSTIQIALLVAPILVLVSRAMGQPMNLVFSNPLELIAVAAAAFVVNSIAEDGETTWFEGVLLLAVYVLLGMAFFFATPASMANS